MDELRVSLTPDLSAVGVLAQRVEAFGDANKLMGKTIYMMNLALEELITNTVSYGLEGVTQPEIEIAAQVNGPVLALTIVDNGQQFDPTQDTHPDLSSPIEDRPIGGLGVYLVKAFADRMTYEYVDGKNRLTLEHDLAP